MTQDSYYAGKGEDVPVNLSAPSNQYAVPQQQQQQQQGAYYAPPYATQQASPYSMPAAQPTYMVSVQHVDSYGSSSHDGSLVPCCASSSRTFDLARAVFVRNVLLIVTAQLLLVAGMSSFFYFIDDVREFIVEQSYWTWIVAFVLELTSLILLLVFRKKKGPAAILLTIFTLASGFFVATLVCFYELRIVIEAVLITFGVVFVCVGYVVITRADFRWLILVILALSMCLLFWSFSFMFYWIYPSIYVYEWYYNVVCLIVIILFVCYLLFDMSLIVNKYPTDEYIFAAVNLYLDILTIFMYVLALLGGRK